MAPGNVSKNLFPTRPLQLNHVAVSLPTGALRGDCRADIMHFHREVFGWNEAPGNKRDDVLVLSINGFDQFLFLTEDDGPMEAPRMDHFGVSVGSLEELLNVHARACSYRERDPRVDVIDPAVEDHKLVKIHNIYVGYLLPLMIEVQCWEFR